MLKIKWKDFLYVMLTLALPIAFQNLLTQTATMVDTIMIGSQGELSVAAVGICSQISSLFFNCYYGFASGSILFFSQYWGSQDEEGENHTFGFTFICMFIVSLIFSIICIFKPEFFLGVYTDKVNIIQTGSPYIRIIGFAYPLQAFAILVSYFLRTSERVKAPLYCSIVGLLVNFCLNYILIYGRFGFPHMGVSGAAVGTLASAIINLTLLVYVLIHSDCRIRIHIHKIFKISFDFIKVYFQKCFPIICNEMLYGVGQMIINVAIGHQSQSAIAAMAAFRVCEGFVFSFFGGLTNASSVVVGQDVGSGNLEHAYQFVKKSAIFCPMVTFTIVLICSLFSKPLLSLFGLGEQALFYGQMMLLIYLFFGSMRTCNYAINECFRAGGESLFGTVLEIGGLFLLSVPATWLAGMVFHIPFLGVFSFVYTDEIVRFVLLVYYLKKGKWIKPVTQQGQQALPAFQKKIGLI